MAQNNSGDPLGVDIFCTSDFPLSMRLTYGSENLQAALVRRLNSDEGSLVSIGDDPDYGYNLASQLNNDFARGDLSSIGTRVRAELEKDVRVQSALARIMVGSG